MEGEKEEDLAHQIEKGFLSDQHGRNTVENGVVGRKKWKSADTRGIDYWALIKPTFNSKGEMNISKLQDTVP